jgi:hypothetical protein
LFRWAAHFWSGIPKPPRLRESKLQPNGPACRKTP